MFTTWCNLSYHQKHNLCARSTFHDRLIECKHHLHNHCGGREIDPIIDLGYLALANRKKIVYRLLFLQEQCFLILIGLINDSQFLLTWIPGQ